MPMKVINQDGSIRIVHHDGWKRQAIDDRDEPYRLKLHPSFLSVGATPTSVDLRPICSAVEDQGPLGSCTANMLAGLVEANEIKSGASLKVFSAIPTVSISNALQASDGTITYTTTVKPGAVPAPTPIPAPSKKLIQVSRLAEYYATRRIEGTTSTDSGATIRNTIKAAYTYGCCDETLWPYDTSKFAVNPSSTVWAAMALHKVTSYHSIADGDITTMKGALAAGFPIGFGFTVYDYFLTQSMATKAFLDLPKTGESIQGGHAVVIVGYDDFKVSPFNPAHIGAFLIRNSWGAAWGQSGYFWMSYEYMKNTNFCSDFWVIQSSPF